MTDYANFKKVKKKFTNAWGMGMSPRQTIKEVGRASFPFPGGRFVPFWVLILMVIELLFVLDIVWALSTERDSLYIPIALHLLTITLILAGFLKRKKLQAFGGRAGFIQKYLRSLIADQNVSPTNNVIVRLIAATLLSLGVATLGLWLIFLAPFNAEELGVRLELHPVLAYVDLWTRVFAVSSLSSHWLSTFGITACVLLVLMIVPVSRWFVKKTLVIHIISIIVWGLFAISTGLWWERLYNITW